MKTYNINGKELLVPADTATILDKILEESPTRMYDKNLPHDYVEVMKFGPGVSLRMHDRGKVTEVDLDERSTQKLIAILQEKVK